MVGSNTGFRIAEILRRHFADPPAADAVQAEREACAKIADNALFDPAIMYITNKVIADAIRASSTPAVANEPAVESKSALLADLEALSRKLRSGANPGVLLYAADDLDRVIAKHTKGASDE